MLSIEEIIAVSTRITNKNLEFTFNKISNNPNVVYKLKKANCIGYSSLFNSIGNHIIKEQKMTDKYEFVHWVGKLTVFGYNVHTITNNSFFKDHDFNEIKDKKTGKIKFVDPSLSDYLGIDYVNKN